MNIAVIFAGGIGKRMNNSATPKQFLKLYGKEIIIYTLEIFENSPLIDGIIVSCLKEKITDLKNLILKYELKKVKSIVAGGSTGQESIYNALKETKKYYSEEDVVLIHDGVRPLINNRIIENNIECVKNNGNSITIVPAIETIIEIDNSTKKIKNIMKREESFVARAPQSFILRDILNSHEKARKEGKNFIDSASLMINYGYKLYTVEGGSENIKITTPIDFFMFKAIKDMESNMQILGL